MINTIIVYVYLTLCFICQFPHSLRAHSMLPSITRVRVRPVQLTTPNRPAPIWIDHARLATVKKYAPYDPQPSTNAQEDQQKQEHSPCNSAGWDRMPTHRRLFTRNEEIPDTISEDLETLSLPSCPIIPRVPNPFGSPFGQYDGDDSNSFNYFFYPSNFSHYFISPSPLSM